jgi:hypothetical protein
MSALSYITPEEEGEAIAFVEKHLGCPAPRMCGYKIAIKIYIKEDASVFKDKDGNDLKIVRPTIYSNEDKYRSCTGLVVGMGPDAYKHDKFTSGPWCRIGDWVVIPRHAGLQYNYRGHTIHSVNDDAIDMVIEDPTHVTRD